MLRRVHALNATWELVVASHLKLGMHRSRDSRVWIYKVPVLGVCQPQCLGFRPFFQGMILESGMVLDLGLRVGSVGIGCWGAELLQTHTSGCVAS